MKASRKGATRGISHRQHSRPAASTSATAQLLTLQSSGLYLDASAGDKRLPPWVPQRRSPPARARARTPRARSSLRSRRSPPCPRRCALSFGSARQVYLSVNVTAQRLGPSATVIRCTALQRQSHLHMQRLCVTVCPRAVGIATLDMQCLFHAPVCLGVPVLSYLKPCGATTLAGRGAGAAAGARCGGATFLGDGRSRAALRAADPERGRLCGNGPPCSPSAIKSRPVRVLYVHRGPRGSLQAVRMCRLQRP